MGTLTPTLPGDIDGLLRVGTPTINRAVPGVVLSPTVYEVDGARGVICAPRFDRSRTCWVSFLDFGVDLSDATARAHVAWWAIRRVDAMREAWRAMPPGPDRPALLDTFGAEEHDLIELAERGRDMTPDQIDAFARLVLRLAGRS